MKRVSDVQQASLTQAIELLGIGHLLDRKPDRLSGGERQRVGIARPMRGQAACLSQVFHRLRTHGCSKRGQA